MPGTTCSVRSLDLFIREAVTRGPGSHAFSVTLSLSRRLHPRNLSRRSFQIAHSSLGHGWLQGSRGISSAAQRRADAPGAPQSPEASGASGAPAASEVPEAPINSICSEDSGGNLKHRKPNERSDSKRVEASPTIERKDNKASRPAKAEVQNPKPLQKEPWQVQKAVLSSKFEEGWSPRKRLSPDALEGIRALHTQYPDKFTTPVLAEQFKVSPEAIRRILKSKWRPSEDEEEDRRRRWDKRGEQIWGNMVELGIKPPKKWRLMGVGKAEPGKIPKWKRSGRISRVSQDDENIPWQTQSQPRTQSAWTADVSGVGSMADRIL